MVERTSLCPIIILLSVLLIADIGLISGIAHVTMAEPNNGRTVDKDGVLIYVVVILPLIAVGMVIVIAMLTLPVVILKPQHSLVPEQPPPDDATNLPLAIMAIT